MCSALLPQSRFLSNAVAVQLTGSLEKLDDTVDWTGSWSYDASSLPQTSLPFQYKRSSLASTLPAWQWALIDGEHDDKVARLFDPPEPPTATPTSDPNSQSQASPGDTAAAAVVPPCAPPSTPVGNPHTPCATTPKTAPNSTPEETAGPPVNLRPLPREPVTAVVTPDDGYSGWWEGSFELQRQGKPNSKANNTIKERFYLRCVGDGRVVGGGTNAYGRFQLYGKIDLSANTLSCARAYLQMPRRKRRRPSESTPNDSATNYNTRKRRVGSKFDHEEFSQDLQVSKSAESSKAVSALAPPTKIKRSPSFSGLAATGGKGKKKRPQTPGDEQDGWKPCFYDEDANEIYEGEVNEYNQRHGYGLLVHCSFDNHIYEGEFVNGKENGKGTLMQGDRTVIYDGEWQDGRIHGRGTYYFSSGDSYTGEWKENARHGRGTYTFYQGSVYDGEWKDNYRCGRGLFTWTDGSYYDGDWFADKKHGRGLLELSDGFYYEGQWARNCFDGRGICVFPNGLRYEGMWKAGKREGRGSLSFPNGVSYEGRFREDRIEGQGTIRMTQPVEGTEPGDWMIPIQFQSDMSRIHVKAGFDNQGK